MCTRMLPGISVQPQRQTAALLLNLLTFFLAMKICWGYQWDISNKTNVPHPCQVNARKKQQPTIISSLTTNNFLYIEHSVNLDYCKWKYQNKTKNAAWSSLHLSFMITQYLHVVVINHQTRRKTPHSCSLPPTVFHPIFNLGHVCAKFSCWLRVSISF